MSLGLFGSRSPPEVEPVAQFGKGAERYINFPLSVTVSLLWHAHTLTPTHTLTHTHIHTYAHTHTHTPTHTHTHTGPWASITGGTDNNCEYLKLYC